MPELVVPRASVADSVRAAAARPDWDAHPAYAGVAHLDDEGFEGWVGGLLADTREGTPRPEGFVPSTNLWWVRGREYLGRVQVRHRLTPRLRDLGGHVGYWVVPQHRRRGHATAMLAAVLPVVRDLGIECALVTCDVGNVASRRTIERNGGLFQDQRGQEARFWVPTG
ncbi:GNAT family N-acetyltransferase [Kineococcus rhizosphaerae]|uniref:Putative acetyltransferase n=1 Tax=Kineococcus rhizosphaerae TaxID=559628 RepID=A0A2T0R2K2_9ACTN|nr:GNAT family N-acetyltransferase [Kineococcus rhizosphaerae]PRY14047.1 putative acetyltransferase [Kineococcus rhizosphaerae]